jgi:inosine-uridine nucleoside N-ribohydrolase
MMTFPHIKQKISKIVLMGGAIDTGNITPAA